MRKSLLNPLTGAQDRLPSLDRLIQHEFSLQVLEAGHGDKTSEVRVSSFKPIAEALTSILAAAALLSAGVLFELYLPSSLQQITGEERYQIEFRSRLKDMGGRIESVLIESQRQR